MYAIEYIEWSTEEWVHGSEDVQKTGYFLLIASVYQPAIFQVDYYDWIIEKLLTYMIPENG